MGMHIFVMIPANTNFIHFFKSQEYISDCIFLVGIILLRSELIIKLILNLGTKK